MSLRERLRRTREWANLAVACHILPQRLKYWVVINEISKVTTNELRDQIVPEIPLQYILEALDDGKKNR